MNTTELKIEAGKFYRTRDGRKVRVYATDGLGPWPIHIAAFMEGGWCMLTRTANGRQFEGSDSGGDLIAPWIDKPEVDWAKLPAWAVAVAKDNGKSWWWYEANPAQEGFSFLPNTGRYGEIPPEYAPKWTGDWRDSLVLREGNV